MPLSPPVAGISWFVGPAYESIWITYTFIMTFAAGTTIITASMKRSSREPRRAEALMREHISSIKTSLIGPLIPARYSIAITTGFPSRNPNICKGVCA
jgi:hypothetical protein